MRKDTPHCENCGGEEPDTHRNDNYTECCNELVCCGAYQDTWTDGKKSVKACCQAVALDQFGYEPDTFWRAY